MPFVARLGRFAEHRLVPRLAHHLASLRQVAPEPTSESKAEPELSGRAAL